MVVSLKKIKFAQI